MIFDLNEALPRPDLQGYDVCIAGGGVAGITLATRLAMRGRRVALLEAGGLEYSEESQKVYRGPILGRSYFDLDSARQRFLGGSSNCWAGWCRPLDAHDFEKRTYIPHSGWPFARAEIDPYLKAAAQILEIEPEFVDREVLDSNNTFSQIHYHLSPPVRFGEKYEEELRTSERIDVFLNSNLVNIHLDEGTGGVSSFECVNYLDPTNRQRLIGKAFVLALGGIENPRLLLNCRDQLPQGIGNNRDLVGRFFMEHPALHCGFYVANKKVWPFGDELFSLNTTKAFDELFLSATTAFRDSQHIGNVVLRLGSIGEGDSRSLFQKFKSQTKSVLCANDIIRDFMQSIRSFRCPVDRPSVEPLPVDSAGYLSAVCEQVPNWNSRVLLAEEKDRFGMRRAALDWRTTDIERRTIKLMVTAFGHYLASRGYGNVKLADWLLIDDSPIPGVAEDPYHGAGYHHMGTTRMATVPEEGVVDPNCRVFGVGNLYIAGSSVFPTGGEANPTLTIVQLTLRLCDHLDRMLAA